MFTPPLPGLLERRISGWCLTRGIVRERAANGWLVHVCADTRLAEYFLVSPTSEELAHVVNLVDGRSDVWVTVLGGLPKAGLDGLAVVTYDERMMMTELMPRTLPAGIEVESSDRVATAIAEVNGDTAARGQAAVTGSDAVFDRIGTELAFRRQGLAGKIMTGLQHWAVSQGADTGLLMASAEGRHLYESLGWREVARSEPSRAIGPNSSGRIHSRRQSRSPSSGTSYGAVDLT
jgi:GNAT superfamily N-acetyltransferase